MKKLIPKLILSLISIALTVKFSLWISETFFFDKFIYQKSIDYGYWVPGKNLSWKDFGKRGQDLIALTSTTKDKKSNTGNVLGASTDKEFTIAIIGDSFVWGQGLKEQDKFVDILGSKLNKILPTKVISLGNSGDGIVENYIKYKMLTTINPDIDLYIFGVVDNDLLLLKNFVYNEILYKEIIGNCPGPFIYEPDTAELERMYSQAMTDSIDPKFGNLCLLEYIASRLPKEKAVYYSFYDYKNSKQLEKILDVLQENKLTVLKPTDKYFAKYKLNSDNYSVSSMESHPSKYANQMFAGQLYDYIVENGYIPK